MRPIARRLFFFARYDKSLASWITPGEEFTVHVGRSPRDLPLSALVRLTV